VDPDPQVIGWTTRRDASGRWLFVSSDVGRVAVALTPCGGRAANLALGEVRPLGPRGWYARRRWPAARGRKARRGMHAGKARVGTPEVDEDRTQNISPWLCHVRQ
jgi:hypothetical protein